MSKNIAPRYLRKLKDGQWFFFKFKEPHPIYGFYTFGYKHPKSDLVIPSNSSRMLLSEFEISYFTPCSEKVAIRLKKNGMKNNSVYMTEITTKYSFHSKLIGHFC